MVAENADILLSKKSITIARDVEDEERSEWKQSNAVEYVMDSATHFHSFDDTWL